MAARRIEAGIPSLRFRMRIGPTPRESQVDFPRQFPIHFRTSDEGGRGRRDRYLPDDVGGEGAGPLARAWSVGHGLVYGDASSLRTSAGIEDTVALRHK